MSDASFDTLRTPKLSLIDSMKKVFSVIMPSNKGTNEIAALDGLRALAVLLVVWLHVASFAVDAGAAQPPFILAQAAWFGGGYGVFLFFNLSGFLLFLPYARAISTGRPLPSIGKFYLRRVLRILPLYYAVIFLLIFLKEPQYLEPANRIPLLFNLFMIGDFRYDSFGAISTQFWTLSIEFQFYLLLPFIAWGIAKLAGRKMTKWAYLRIGIGVSLLIVYGLVIRGIVNYYHYVKHFDLIGGKGIKKYITALLYGVDGKFIEIFALGIGISFLYVWAVEQKHLSVQSRNIIGIIALLLALISAVSAAYIQSLFTLKYIWAVDMSWQNFGSWGIGCCCAILLISVLFSPAIIQSIWSVYPLRFIGLISYGIYLWHFPLLETISPLVIPGHLNTALIRLWLSGVSISILFASATYYLIEKPFLSLRVGLRGNTNARVSEGIGKVQDMQTVKRPAVIMPIQDEVKVL